MKHLRAMASLFVLTLFVCCVLYPLALWGFGRAIFPSRAAGSLIEDGDNVRGSRLIAQPFTQPKYFKPRPSAVDYKANASGGSNLAASNPLLRDRVARELGKIAKFKDGKRVGPEVQTWFAANPGLLGKWAGENKTLAKRWVKDDENKNAVRAWLASQPDLLPEDKKDATKLTDDDLGALGQAILTRFAKLHPGSWPVPMKVGVGDEARHSLTVVEVKAGGEDVGDLQSVLFDYWLARHPERAGEIEKVPADLVLASGSGLDPHVTMRAARYQLDDVVAARVAETKLERAEVRRRIERLLEKHSFRAFGFLGEPLINVLEVNLAMDDEFGGKKE